MKSDRFLISSKMSGQMCPAHQQHQSPEVSHVKISVVLPQSEPMNHWNLSYVRLEASVTSQSWKPCNLPHTETDIRYSTSIGHETAGELSPFLGSNICSGGVTKETCMVWCFYMSTAKSTRSVFSKQSLWLVWCVKENSEHLSGLLSRQTYFIGALCKAKHSVFFILYFR